MADTVTKQIEEGEKTVRVVQLDTTFTPDARQRVIRFLQSFVSFKPVLGLLYGAPSPESRGEGTWSITALGQETVDDMIAMYSSFGAVICYDIDGIETVIPQIGHINELESAVLEFSGDRLRAVRQNP